MSRGIFSALAVWTQVPLANRTASTIKSIQRGTITITSTGTSATASLSPTVDTTKAELRHLGTTFSANTALEFGTAHTKLVLTNSSTVTCTRGDATDLGANNLITSWELTEHY